MSKRKMIQSIANIYQNVNKEKGASYFQYDELDISWSTPENYQVIRKIGRGKYSEVFEGINIANNKLVVIKILKPVRIRKIKREVKILENLYKATNTIRLVDTVKSCDSKIMSFIFENIGGTDLKTASQNFTPNDIRFYIYQLCKALNHCHSMGIIHRDVKSRNIIVNTEKRMLRLIDWGLAEFYHSGQEYNVRVATRNYKGPELLVNYVYYHYSLDMWSVGCVLAGMIFKKDPFFRGSSNIDMISKLAKVLGSKGLEEYTKKYRAFSVGEIKHVVNKKFPRRSWKDFENSVNKHLVSEDAYDLLDKLLVYDHQKRITAEEAMKHHYFDPIRMIAESGRDEGIK